MEPAAALPRGNPFRGEPQGQIPDTALVLQPFSPPCHGWPSRLTACPAVRTSGRGDCRQWTPSQRFPGDLLPPADVPGACRLKGKSLGASWRGRDPLRGVPSGGLLAVRQTPPSNSIPSAFLPRALLEARPSEPVALLPEFLVATGRHASTGESVPAASFRAKVRAYAPSLCCPSAPLGRYDRRRRRAAARLEHPRVALLTRQTSERVALETNRLSGSSHFGPGQGGTSTHGRPHRATPAGHLAIP